MRAALLCGLAGLLVGVSPSAGAGAEQSERVKADVVMSGGVRSYRCQVTVKSKDAERRVLAVLVGELPGLPVKPTALKVPSGWQGRVLERARPGRTAWAVEVSCVGDEAGSQESPEEPERQGCGLRAGEELRFEFDLPYEEAGLASEPVFLSFSDGRTGIAG